MTIHELPICTICGASYPLTEYEDVDGVTFHLCETPNCILTKAEQDGFTLFDLNDIKPLDEL